MIPNRSAKKICQECILFKDLNQRVWLLKNPDSSRISMLRCKIGLFLQLKSYIIRSYRELYDPESVTVEDSTFKLQKLYPVQERESAFARELYTTQPMNKDKDLIADQVTDPLKPNFEDKKVFPYLLGC